MATKKNHVILLKKLKKQVSTLKRKEKMARNKLRAALSKAKKIAKAYERKLEKKTKDAKAKIVAVEAAVYTKLANSIKKKAEGTKKAAKKKRSVSRIKKTK